MGTLTLVPPRFGYEALEAQGKNLADTIAVIDTALGDGDHDQAFHWFDVAYKSRIGSLIFLKTDPSMDPLRDDTRFAVLLRRMRLP